MKTQPTFSFTNVKNLTLAILMLAVLLFVAGNVQAKKPQPEPGPGAPDIEARWGGDDPTPGIVEGDVHLCSLSQVALDETSGTFTCEMNGEKVFYDFESMISEPVHKKGDDWRCLPETRNLYNDPDMEYSFNWNGNCSTTEGCDVTVVNAFSNPGVIGGSVSRLTLEAFGMITESELNPFTESQSLTIDYLHVTLFAAKGHNKVLAVCKLTPMPGYPVTLVTNLPE